MFENTIAAISTSLQDGAISIIRLSGDKAIEITQKIFDRNIMNAKSHTIHYGFIIDTDKNPVDEVLISIFRAPKTYTREDIVEINCHGGTFITRKILSMVLSAGADLAKPGEFTQRAFYHGRIDLSQAEAVQDMIEASNNTAASMAIHGIKGSVKKLLQPLIDDLMDIIAQIEVNIDYPEYDDVIEITNNEILPSIRNIKSELQTTLLNSMSAKLLKNGINTVIVGRPNVGKSSLLNAILNENKAIVTNIPGTTRDIVESSIQLDNVTLNLIDTAGIRDTEDVVEQIGVEKSKEALDRADIVLFVLDGSVSYQKEDEEIFNLIKNKCHLIVVNKSDLIQKIKLPQKSFITISTKEEESIKKLEEAILTKLKLNNISNKDITYISNARQIEKLNNAIIALEEAINVISEGYQIDFVDIYLRKAWLYLGEIIGETSTDSLLDELFSKFCLGK